jgi:hypothetical protein
MSSRREGAPIAERLGKLLIAADGGVAFLHDGEVHRWRADGGSGLLGGRGRATTPGSGCCAR